MVQLGFKLSSEEHSPIDLISQAQRAEEAGFGFGMISDHYHPWIDRQGHAPFVWSVIGGISQVTRSFSVVTGVTCPTVRIHPAIIAQAAATSAMLLPGRFMLGVGTGENLNEHILGGAWPSAAVRREMLDEAIEVIRALWQGDFVSHRGPYYTVENARIYSLPQQPPPIYVAASGERSAQLAAEKGDGLVSTAPKGDLVKTFKQAGGSGKPCYAEISVCWAASEKEARKTAYSVWPNAALGGELSQELPLPRHFEQAAATVREEDLTETVPCGPDPERHRAAIKQYIDAGFDAIAIHQIGPDQEGFFRFYEREVLPAFQ
ncbi:MAG: TIGR03557 family F420-dependent LLM class oxidoreductase [Chloroflexota bacterium]